MSKGVYHVLINGVECRVLITRREDDVKDLKGRGWEVDAVFTSFKDAIEYAHKRVNDEYIVEWYLEDEIEEVERANAMMAVEN